MNCPRPGKVKSKLWLLGVLPMLLAGPVPAAEPLPTPLLTKPEAELLAVLNSAPSDKEIADACRELAVVGSKAAVPALAWLLADERFSHGARQALETIPDPSVDAALRGQLAKANGRVLVGIISSLGVRRDAKAVKPLKALLANADPAVAEAAARALGSIATAEATLVLQTELPWAVTGNQPAICEGLLRSAETLLATGKPNPALAIYEQVGALTNLPPQVRAAAVRGEIIARGPESLELFEHSLLVTEYELFAAAIRAALELRQPDITAALAEMLPLIPGDGQLVAIQALGELGGDDAVAALLPMVRAGGKTTGLAAMRAAIATGEAAVVPLLVESLSSTNRVVAAVAADGLAGFANSTAVIAINALLTSPAAPQRVMGIELAGRRRMTSALPEFLKATADPAATVRVAALKRLGEFGSVAELEPLLQRLGKMSEARELEAAGEAASAICARAANASEVTAVLIRAYNQAAPAPKATLLGVLGGTGGAEALRIVSLELRDPNPTVRQAAVRALAEWPDASASPILVQILSTTTDSSARDLAFSGLIRMTRDSGLPNDAKLQALGKAAMLAKTPADNRLILAGLGDIPTMESLRAVAIYLSDAEVAEDAGASAVRIAEQLDGNLADEITPILQQVLKVAKSAPVLAKARAQIKQLNKKAGAAATK